MAVNLVYVNTADRAEAQRIGRALVESRLAAAANIVPQVSSIHRWRGEVREAAEALLVLKTTSALVGAVIERVRSMHAYECPSILAMPVEAGNPDYLAWVEAETASEAGSTSSGRN
jgi:periplasmic divalent cation tolerance protein